MANRLDQINKYLNSQKQNRIVSNRNLYPVNRNQLRDHIYDKKYREVVDKCFDVIAANKHIFHHGDIQDYSRQQERERGAKMVVAYHKLRPVNTLDIQTDPHSVSLTAHASYYFDPGLSVRTDITLFLYCKTLIAFRRDDSQVHQAFIRSALTAEHIGCFGLTEIGHGSDTKNIQTVAVYDHKSQELILNTPSEAALKFWIGGAAQTASHAVIWAQLVVKGKKQGVHPFIVPLRDRRTMKVYEGVIIGDCGSKIGLHLIDNGYIGFRNYRIPLENALDRISGVDSKGQFRTIEANAQKRHGMYISPLSVGRAFITINSIASSLNALLISIKYSCTRRQFQSASRQEEQLLIDYPLVQFRLMPLLASAFVCFVGGANVLRSYDDNFKEMLKPKSKVANQLHGISAAAKARSSWLATEIIGTCRHLLGGHGYSGFSRLGRLYFDQQLNTTWEGDNHMLLQQSVKYVLKTIKKLKQTLRTDNILNFVNDELVLPQNWDKQSILSIDSIQKILQKRLLSTHDELINLMFQLKANQVDNLDVWNQGQPYHGKKLALLYCDLYYFTVFRRKTAQMQPELKQLSQQCLRLWFCYHLEKDRWGNAETRALIQKIIPQLCQWLTPRSVSLVEALAAPEAIIGSPFADWNGDRMWQKYLGLIYAGKDAFSRVPYYQQIIEGRNA